MALVELRGVCKSFRKGDEVITPLDNIDLDIEAGEFLSLMGPSGTGKSTLLNIIGTLDRPTSGTITFKDLDLRNQSEANLANLRNAEIGFVFQLHHLLPQCSVLENILVPTLVTKNADDVVERAKRLLDRVGLSERAHQLPGKLSGGERQRAAVVRALINKPSLLLADEPTGSLNQQGAEHLTQLLLELNREEQMTLVVVTHSEEVARMMGRVFELREGTLHERAPHHG